MSSYESVKAAISRRMLYQHMDLIVTYGIEAVVDAIDDKASSFEGVELDEIGTSDVSCWVNDIKETLERNAAKVG